MWCPPFQRPTFDLLIARLAAQVLDVGCGVGGPLREIALFSGAHITGGSAWAEGLAGCRMTAHHELCNERSLSSCRCLLGAGGLLNTGRSSGRC